MENKAVLIGYSNLAKAIVHYAMKDYRKAYKNFLKNDTPQTREALVPLRRFFTSDWYRTLFDYDGRYMMEAIEKNALNPNGMKMRNFKCWDLTR